MLFHKRHKDKIQLQHATPAMPADALYMMSSQHRFASIATSPQKPFNCPRL
jgi:hypothetical protein